jgi:hypothetical protein
LKTRNDDVLQCIHSSVGHLDHLVKSHEGCLEYIELSVPDAMQF